MPASFLQVAFGSQSLSKLIRKQNIPFAEYDTYKTLKELGKSVRLGSLLTCLQETAPDNTRVASPTH